jgi:hydrogenase-1 operon protein HyaF
MNLFPIPVVALGPGSQPEAESLHYLPMPQEMRTFEAPLLPEPESLWGLSGARSVLGRARDAARDWVPGPRTIAIDLQGLSGPDLEILDQVLGQGEVSARIDGPDGTTRIQESVFAGIWRVRRFDPNGVCVSDHLDVGGLPCAVIRASGSGRAQPTPPSQIPAGANSAPALLAEIAEHLRAGTPAHVINLTLLPFSPDDGEVLERALGQGIVSLLSRGYGNCRVTATGVARLWWVQYFNSQDVIILNTLEITEAPDVIRAAPEDLEDSARRLGEVLDWIH